MQDPQEWESLVRQGGDGFPPDWGQVMSDTAYWREAVRQISVETGLPLTGEIEAGVAGSNAVFLVGDYVVKIYAAPWPVWYAREIECLRILEAVPAARAPRLVAHGPAANADAAHPYIVIERLPGEPLNQVWERLTPRDRSSLAAQISEITRALHGVPLHSLRAFPITAADWIARMRARAEGCEDYLRQNDQLPAHLLEELPGYLEANQPLLEQDFTSCLLSADMTGDHILVEERAGAWTVTGHIDFGDAEVGPVEYEWVALCLDALQGDTAAIRAFFAAYGWPLPLSPAARQRLKLYTLLHRFAAPLFNAERGDKPVDAPTLDALLDSLWPV